MDLDHGSVAQQSPAEKVVQAVATHIETDPLDLPPLQAAIDADALNAFVRGVREGEITFQYAGAAVTIYSDGAVDVAEKPREGRVSSQGQHTE